MKLSRPAARQLPENVVPLINVVFLLLIFFVLTSAFVTPSPFAVDPPSVRRLEAGPEEARRISLAADGRLALEDRVMEREALLEALAGEPGPIILAAGGETPAGEVFSLLNDLKMAGVETVLLRGLER